MNIENPQFDNQKPLSFEEWKAAVSTDEYRAVREAEIITHLAKSGRQPSTGIPLIDAFIDVGCPCKQCMRDEFLS